MIQYCFNYSGPASSGQIFFHFVLVLRAMKRTFLINFGVGEKMNKKRVEQKYYIYVVFNFIYFSLQQKFLSKCEFVKQLETVLQNAVT